MSTFTLSKEQFQQFQLNFRAKAQHRDISSADILLYNIIRGKQLDRGFTEITNQTKLNSGFSPTQGFDHARFSLSHQLRHCKRQVREQFGEILSDDIIENINELC